jgi:hypothetical protein
VFVTAILEPATSGTHKETIMKTTYRPTPTPYEQISTPAPRTPWRTEAELAAFGIAVYEDGLAAYPHLVQDLARAGRSVAPAAAAALASKSEPTVVRERALAVVSAALVRSLPAPR